MDQAYSAFGAVDIVVHAVGASQRSLAEDTLPQVFQHAPCISAKIPPTTMHPHILAWHTERFPGSVNEMLTIAWNDSGR